MPCPCVALAAATSPPRRHQSRTPHVTHTTTTIHLPTHVTLPYRGPYTLAMPLLGPCCSLPLLSPLLLHSVTKHAFHTRATHTTYNPPAHLRNLAIQTHSRPCHALTCLSLVHFTLPATPPPDFQALDKHMIDSPHPCPHSGLSPVVEYPASLTSWGSGE